MDRLHLRTRVTRRGDELVIAIPDHLAPTHVREGDEVSVVLRPDAPARRTVRPKRAEQAKGQVWRPGRP